MAADQFDVQRKVAVVIGGAGYLCSTLAGAMAKAGMRVILIDVTQPAALPPSVLGFLPGDVTQKAEL